MRIRNDLVQGVALRTSCLLRGKAAGTQPWWGAKVTATQFEAHGIHLRSKSESFEHEVTLFRMLQSRDVVTWKTMEEDEVTSPKPVTAPLQAHISVGAMQQGKELLAQIQERGTKVNVVPRCHLRGGV